MTEEGLVTIDSFVNVTAASLARVRLEAEGIRCHLANERLAGLRDGIAPALLQVSAEDAERARAVLAEDLEDAPIDPEDGPVCPECNGQYAESERTFWSWLANLVTFGRIPVQTVLRCRKCGHVWPPEVPQGAPYRT